MGLLQGSQLPDVSTVQTTSTDAPSWYTDYLQNVASKGQNNTANYVGQQPLQTQASTQAQANVNNWQPNINTAQGYLGQVGNYDPTKAGAGALGSAQKISGLAAAQPYLDSAANPTYNTVQNYLNPYTKNVVDQIGTLAQQNILNNIAPQTAAGLVGSGQFGSQRGAAALASNLGQYGQQTTAQQVNALNTGYQNAATQAQSQALLQQQIGATAGQIAGQQQSNLASIGQVQGNQAAQQQQNLNAAAQIGGQLAQTVGNLGWQDVNGLNTLGTQQQQSLQQQQLFPLQIAQLQAGLLQGAQVPTSTTSTYRGPVPGAYQNSTLSNISGVGSLLNGATSGALSNLIGSGVNKLSGSLFNTFNNPTQYQLDQANSSSDPIGSLINSQGAGGGSWWNSNVGE